MKVKVFAAIAGAMLLAGCQTTNTLENARFSKAVPMNGQIMLNYWTSINPDCTASGPINVSIIEQPRHGRVTVSQTRVYPNYSSANLRSRCNAKRVPAVQAIYKPDANYLGSDSAAFRAIFRTGTQWNSHYKLEVK